VQNSIKYISQILFKVTVSFALIIAMVFFCLIPPVTALASASTTAPIAVLMDFDTGEILFERNMEQRWIPASMTKILTAFIVYQEIEAGNLAFDTELVVSENAARISASGRLSGINVRMREGDLVDVETLLRLMMIPSDNISCIVVAEHISGSEEAFLERMNETAAELGMYGTFSNSHGAGIHHTNAYSIAILIREFITRYPDILRITAMPSVNFGGRTFNSTNHLVRGTAFEGTDGFKTGSLRQARWNHSTTAERGGRRLIAVVMNTPTNAARQQQSRLLLNYGFAELARREAAITDSMRVHLHGNLVSLDTSPRLYRGKVMLPFDSLSERVGRSAIINEEHGIVTLSSPVSRDITLFIDRNLVIVNNVPREIDSPGKIFDGEIFVSLDFVGLITGTIGTWNKNAGLILFRAG